VTKFKKFPLGPKILSFKMLFVKITTLISFLETSLIKKDLQFFQIVTSVEKDLTKDYQEKI